jgi:hypothetical protein
MPHQCPAVCVPPSPAEPPEVVPHNVDVAVCIFGDDRRGTGMTIRHSCDFTNQNGPALRFTLRGLRLGLKSVGQNRPIAKFTKGRDTKKNATRSAPVLVETARATGAEKRAQLARFCTRDLRTDCRPPTQWRSKKVSAESFPKTGIFPISAGDFGQFLAIVALFGVWRHLAELKKARISGAFRNGDANYLKLREWLAGAGGFELRHSRFENVL